MPGTQPFIEMTALSPGREMSPMNFSGAGGSGTVKSPSWMSERISLRSADGFSNHSTHSVAANSG